MKNCEKCEYARKIYAAPDNWSFKGCTHKPYKGKFCAEIKECPKEKKKEEH